MSSMILLSQRMEGCLSSVWISTSIHYSIQNQKYLQRVKHQTFPISRVSTPKYKPTEHHRLQFDSLCAILSFLCLRCPTRTTSSLEEWHRGGPFQRNSLPSRPSTSAKLMRSRKQGGRSLLLARSVGSDWLISRLPMRANWGCLLRSC